jgi:hypothetical protein
MRHAQFCSTFLFHNAFGGAPMAHSASGIRSISHGHTRGAPMVQRLSSLSSLFNYSFGGIMKQLSAFLVVLLTGIVLMPQHAWSQPGAIVNNGLQLQGTLLNILFYDGTYTGTLLPTTLSGNRTWTLPNDTGTILLSTTTFGAAGTSDATVSGTYDLLNIQLNAGVVGTSEIANGAVTSAKILDGTIVDADISSSANIAVSKLAVTANRLIVGDGSNQGSLLAPGSDGQVLTIVSGTPTWQTLSGTVPNGTAADQLLRWNGSAWQAVNLNAGSGISITHGTGITVTNIGDTDPSDDLTTSTTFSAAGGSDATVSGAYNALNIQLNAGVVGSTEIADGEIVDADISPSANITVSKLAVTANRLIVGDASNQGSLLAPGTPGQVLRIDASGAPTWQPLSGTVPNGTAANQLLRWNDITNAWEAVSLTQGTGISITHGASDITVTNTGDTDSTNDLTTTTTFSAAAGSDATVSGAYNALNIQLNAGVVGSTEIADGSITNDDISPSANIDVSKLAVTQNYLIVGDASNQGSLLAPGSNGDVLMIVSGTPTWSTLSGTVPNGTAANQLLRWNNTTNAWEAVSLTAGTGIDITHSGTAITVTNTGDTDSTNDLTTTTSFSAAATSDATVSGTYDLLNIQLKTGVVGTSEIADGAIVDADISPSANIAVSKLAPGSDGQVLTISGGVPTWQPLSGTVPNGTSANQLLRWNNTTNAWEAVSLTQGTGIDITHGAGIITVTNIGDTNPSDDLTTTTTFSAAATSDATVSGTYNSLDIQLKTGVVGTSEIADGTIVDDDIATGANIAVSKLAPGSNGQVLTISGGVPTWTSLSAAGGWAVGGNTLSSSPGILGTLSSHDLEVQTNGTLAMYINASNQHVGIGTNDPQSRLHVHGSAVRVTNSSTGSTATDGFVVGLSSSDAELRQNENARILFNTNAAAGSDTVEAQLTSTGQLAFFTTGTPGFRVDLPNNSANAVGRIRAVGLSYWSSQQWKQDIRPIPNALEKTLALRGVNYRWKPEYGGSDDIGFIMEEVASVVPEVVQRDERTGELQGMDYARLTALLVEALKEEHRRNEELRAELAQLRKLVERVAMQQGITSGGSSINVRVDGDWLGQNIPNPHDGTTTIPCYVPAGVSNAQLVVADVAGQLIRSVTISARNTWTNVTLDMTLLASGTYEYRLVFDGRTVATKQMQLVR